MTLKRSLLWLRSVLLRGRLEREMQDEMGEHIDRATVRLMARGMTEPEARRAAMREFGNVTYLQEEGRLARGTGALDALLADVGYAARQFRRRPWITATMIAVLALGMAVTTALYSVRHSFVTAPPQGVPALDDMVRIRTVSQETRGRLIRPVSLEEVEAYHGLTDQFRMVTAWREQNVPFGATDDDSQLGESGDANFVTATYFEVFGVQPAFGRALTAADYTGGAAPVAVIGDLVWERVFARSPDVLGRVVMVNGAAVTVVGIAPAKFSPTNVWLPLQVFPQVVPGASLEEEAYRLAARLQPGVSRAGATAAVNAVAKRAQEAAERASPEPLQAVFTADVMPMNLGSDKPNFESERRNMTLGMGALALVVLLVTCTNVSALLAGIAIARRREVAIRLSLGAARARVVRQLLTENMLLATAAVLFALALLAIAQRLVTVLVPDLPIRVGVSVPSAIFAFGLAITVGLLFGLSPVLHATRVAVVNALRDSSSSIAGAQARLQRSLVVIQIAFTQPLVVGLTGMLVLLTIAVKQEGMNPAADEIVTMRMRATAVADGYSPEMALVMMDLRERLEAAPGIDAAVPEVRYGPRLGGYTVHAEDRVAGGTQETVRIAPIHIAAGWLDAVNIPLIAGRDFAAADTTGMQPRTEAPVVIGDELAKRLWAGENPLGRRLQPPTMGEESGPLLTVVGVFDAHPDPDAAEWGYSVYVPQLTSQLAQTALTVRTATSAEPLYPAMREIVRATPGVILTQLRTQAAEEADDRRDFMMLGAMLASAGALTLALAAIGLYAVIALAVGQRTSEIAVRMALGARARAIVRKFASEGVRLAAIGVVLGMPLSVLALRFVTGLSDAGQSMSWLLVGVVAITGVLGVAAMASLGPARRAAIVEPATVLRND